MQSGRQSSVLISALVVLSVPLVRPNILGEQWSAAAAGMVFAAALLAVAADGGRVLIGSPGLRPARSVVFWLGLAYLTLIAQATFSSRPVDIQPLWQGVALTVGVVAASAVVLADTSRWQQVAKGFVGLVLLTGMTYFVTVLIWAVAGIGAAEIGTVRVGSLLEFQPVYAPLTVTSSDLTFNGVTIPRLVGFAREPGWMAMYGAFAYFLLPRIGWDRRWMRLVLLLVVLGTISTAGFGVFVVTWAYEAFLRPRRGAPSLHGFVRQVFGLVVTAGAVWVALNAPALGLHAKTTVNAVSYNDRAAATDAGWSALLQGEWWGGLPGSGINLIAAVASDGLPFVVCILAALLMPRLGHPRAHLTTAPIAVLLFTLLLSQPPQDSTWVFVLAVMVYAAPLRDGRREGGIADRHDARTRS